MKTKLLASLRWVMPVAVIAAACGLFRWVAAGGPPEDVPPARQQPWTIGPRYDYPLVATDEQLVAVLNRMVPPKEAVNTNHLVHALRLWGPAAVFDDPGVLSGEQMRRYFLDDAQFRLLAGDDAPPLFTLDGDEVRVRTWDQTDRHRNTSSVHVDDLLATLAESGTPLEEPLLTRDGATTVSALLAGAMRRFHLQQHEYEWTAISYARYLFPAEHWQNHYGQRIDVERLIDELIDHPLRSGICGGTHRLEALVVLYRADEQAEVLSRRAKQRMLAHMAKVSALLAESQHPQGYWTKRWYAGGEALADAPVSQAERILATGHHLEWLALAPPEVQPPREHVIRAGQWLVRAMTEIDEKTLRKEYGPSTHAARALCLWRSKDPFEAWREGR